MSDTIDAATHKLLADAVARLGGEGYYCHVMRPDCVYCNAKYGTVNRNDPCPKRPKPAADLIAWLENWLVADATRLLVLVLVLRERLNHDEDGFTTAESAMTGLLQYRANVPRFAEALLEAERRVAELNRFEKAVDSTASGT